MRESTARARGLPHRSSGGRRRRLRTDRVDWRAPVAEPFYRATGREPMGLARRRHFAVEGRNLLGIEDELFGERPPRCRPRRRARWRSADAGAAAAWLQHADRLDRARPHRHARRHRRHDPGRAGRDHPLAAGRRAGRAGWSGHRQDGGGAAPRRLPALHAPLPARRSGRAGDRTQPGVPALHRAGAAVARRGRRRAGRAGRSRSRRALRSGAASQATRRWRRGSRATPA